MLADTPLPRGFGAALASVDTFFPRAPEQFVASPLCLVGYVRWDARSDRVPPLQTIIFSSFTGRTPVCRPSTNFSGSGAGRAPLLQQRTLLASLLRYEPADPRYVCPCWLPGPRAALLRTGTGRVHPSEDGVGAFGTASGTPALPRSVTFSGIPESARDRRGSLPGPGPSFYRRATIDRSRFLAR